jgi:hypothetical protein
MFEIFETTMDVIREIVQILILLCGSCVVLVGTFTFLIVCWSCIGRALFGGDKKPEVAGIELPPGRDWTRPASPPPPPKKYFRNRLNEYWPDA